MERDQEQRKQWWGEFRLAEDEAVRHRIGPLDIVLQRLRREWRVALENRAEGAEEDVVSTMAVPAQEMETIEGLDRYVFRATTEAYRIVAALADRPVVARPSSPFNLPPGEEATVYVSSPLWVRIENGAARVLKEAPILRPSDTWFGPSTREGELCYASQTSCRTALEEIPLRPHRAVTAVRIGNKAKKALLLERLSLPVVHLSLFASPQSLLWTESVSMIREEDEDLASLRIEKKPPTEAGTTSPLGGPRKAAEKGMWTKALSKLFG